MKRVAKRSKRVYKTKKMIKMIKMTLVWLMKIGISIEVYRKTATQRMKRKTNKHLLILKTKLQKWILNFQTSYTILTICLQQKITRLDCGLIDIKDLKYYSNHQLLA